MKWDFSDLVLPAIESRIDAVKDSAHRENFCLVLFIGKHYFDFTGVVKVIRAFVGQLYDSGEDGISVLVTRTRR